MLNIDPSVPHLPRPANHVRQALRATVQRAMHLYELAAYTAKRRARAVLADAPPAESDNAAVLVSSRRALRSALQRAVFTATAAFKRASATRQDVLDTIAQEVGDAARSAFPDHEVRKLVEVVRCWVTEAYHATP